jgi:hypothetical protein
VCSRQRPRLVLFLCAREIRARNVGRIGLPPEPEIDLGEFGSGRHIDITKAYVAQRRFDPSELAERLLGIAGGQGKLAESELGPQLGQYYLMARREVQSLSGVRSALLVAAHPRL